MWNCWHKWPGWRCLDAVHDAPSPVLSGRLRLVTQQLGDLLGAVQLSQLSVTNKCRAQYAQSLKSAAKRSLQRDHVHPQWLMAFYFLSGPFWQLHPCSLRRKDRRHSLQEQFNVGLGSTCMLPKCSRVFFICCCETSAIKLSVGYSLNVNC